jgi:hypothetical protein
MKFNDNHEVFTRFLDKMKILGGKPLALYWLWSQESSVCNKLI